MMLQPVRGSNEQSPTKAASTTPTAAALTSVANSP